MFAVGLASSESGVGTPFVAPCCGNSIPHVCRCQVDNDGGLCGSVCYKPSPVANYKRAWFSTCPRNHHWYSCCCCVQSFKNWGQYRKHKNQTCPFRHSRTSSCSSSPSSVEDNPEGEAGVGERANKKLKGLLQQPTASSPALNDETSASAMNDETYLPAENVEDEMDDSEETPKPICPFNVLPMKEMPEFHRKASTVYFDRDRDGNGPASLVARAMTKSGEENYKYLRKDDVELAMILTDLCSRLSRPQKKLFCEFLSRYNDKVTLDAQGGNDYGSISVDIETDFPGLRRTIYESTNSIYKNLPHPPVEILGDHACVSVIACLEDLLAHGHDIDVIHPLLEVQAKGPVVPTNEDDDAAPGAHDDMLNTPFKVTKLGESLAAATILQNKKDREDAAQISLTTYAIEWKDDCEPNNIKQHQGGVFVSTFNFATLPSQRNSLNHTYVVAVGPQHVNHDCVEQKMARELRILSGQDPGVAAPTFYSKKHGGILAVHLELISSLADQPMRRFMNGLIAGNGTYGARFGMSIDLASVIDKVAACDTCLARMLSGFPVGECEHCTNWDMSNERIRMNTPANYPPEEEDMDGDGMIPPRVITYKNLKAVVTKAHEKYVSGLWGDKATVAFLTSHALSTQAIKEIVQHAEGALVYKR